MDAERFDALARSLFVSPSRRSLLGAVVGGALATVGMDRAEAKKSRKKKKCKNCGECQQCTKRKCVAKPDGTACSGGSICQGGICASGCTCTAPAICGGPDGECCDPEGTPCTSFAGCCSGECDFLVGGGTCGSCRGLFCNAQYRCCAGVPCINNRCDGCLDRAIVCTRSDQCCFSECNDGVCLSAEGRRCVNDADCRACYLDGLCENACVDGTCAF